MDNFKYMILNGAIGDTYGAPIEMMPNDVILSRYGVIDKYIVNDKIKNKLYTYTDDTQMTIALINYLIDSENIFIKEKIMHYWSKYFEPYRGYSDSTHNLILHYITTGECKEKESESNGTLMRISPISVVSLLKKYNDEDLMNLIKITHYPTHISEESYYTSFVFIRFLEFLFNIKNEHDKFSLIKKYLSTVKDENNFNINKNIEYICQNLEKVEYDIVDNVIGLDGILCWEALSCAMVALLKNINNPIQIVPKAITYGGDCDTIGAIAGQMSGILFGLDSIRKDWLSNLENLSYIESIITKLINTYD